jgi:hypothetical protein
MPYALILKMEADLCYQLILNNGVNQKFNIFIYFETYSLIASLLIVIVLKDILNI